MPRLLLLGVALVHITAAAAATGTSETSDPVNGVSGSGDDETPTLVPFAQPTIVPSTASPTPGPTAAPALLLTQAGPCMEYVPCGLIRSGTARHGASVSWTMIAKIPQVYTFDTCASSADTVLHVDGVEYDQDACRDLGRNYGERVSVSLVAGQVVTIAVRNYLPWTAESEVRLSTTCAVATTAIELTGDRPAGVCVDPVPCDNALERLVTPGGEASWLLRAANSEAYSFDFCGSDHAVASVTINDEVHTQSCASGAGGIVLPFLFGDLIRVSAIMADDQALGIVRMLPGCSGILPPAPTHAPSTTPTTSQPTAAPTRRPTAAPATPEPTAAPITSAPTSTPTAWPTYFPTASPFSSSPSLAPTTTTTTTTTWIMSCYMHYGDEASCTRSSNQCTFSEEHGVCLDSAQTVQCTAHNGCDSEYVRSYCDRLYQCHSCFWCGRFNDAIDGRCPPSCTDSTLEPTVPPTVAPTRAPTTMPTPAPTLAPSEFPSTAPSRNPTTRNPTNAADTFSPTVAPTYVPTIKPTPTPTPAPTPAPSQSPTRQPTPAPRTPIPTLAPSPSPTTAPTLVPTSPPTDTPSSNHPTANPSLTPSLAPASSTPTTSTPTANPTTTPIYSIVRVPIGWDSLSYDDRQGERGDLLTGIYDMIYNMLLPGDVIGVDLRRGLVVPNSVSATISFRTFDARARIEAQLCRCSLHVLVTGTRYDPVLQSDFDNLCPDNCETTTTTVTSSTHTETTPTFTTATSSTLTSTTATHTTNTDTTATVTTTTSTVTATTATATSSTVTTATATSSTLSTTTVTATADPCLIFECSNDCTGLCGWGWNRQEGRGDCRTGGVTTAAMYNLGNCQRNATVDTGSQNAVESENNNAADSSFIVSVAILGAVIIAVLCILVWFQKRGCSCDDPNRVQAFKTYGVESGYTHGAQSIAVSPMLASPMQHLSSGGSNQLRSQLQQEQEIRRRVLQESSIDSSIARQMLADSADSRVPGATATAKPPAKVRQMREEPVKLKPAPSPAQVRGPDHLEPEPEPKPEPKPEPQPPPRLASLAQPVQSTPATPATRPRVVNLPTSSDSSSDTGAPVWLHGNSSKEAATKLMAASAVEGTFFVREVEGRADADYALCVCFRGKPTHHGIRKVGGDWQVNNMTEHNKPSFVDFVEQFKKPLQGWPVPFTTAVPVSAGGVPPTRAVGTQAIGTRAPPKLASTGTWPSLALHVHPKLGKEGSATMLRDKSSGAYTAGHFLFEATEKEGEYALCVNYKGAKAPSAKLTRHHVCPNDQGMYSVNKKLFGEHTTPEALVEALSVPGPASARSGWPVALSKLVAPVWLRLATHGAKVQRTAVEDELKGSDGKYSPGKFLVRDDPDQGVAVLSVNFRGKPTHHGIKLVSPGIVFWGNSYSHVYKLVEALSRPNGGRPKNANGQEWPVQLKSS